ncbi:MAG TPA: YqhA family protein, partial [Rhizomicrobium sp.]|nr:YqhA family protein [Rhizomicrobium sp.]
MSAKKIERALEMFLFTSRWLMAPFYIGLVVALVALLAVFVNEIIHTVPTLFSGGESAVVVWVLTLIDLSLAANLLL